MSWRRTKKSIKNWITLILFASAAFAGYVAGGKFWERRPSSLAGVRDAAPDFSYKNLSGKTVRLSDYKGKIVLLDFWATWCAPCLEELPDLKAVHDQYKSKNFTVLGVSIDEGGEQEVSSFVREYRVPYPIVMSGGLDAVPEGYQLRAIPTAFLIGPDGLIRRKFMGYKRREELSREIEKILKETN